MIDFSDYSCDKCTRKFSRHCKHCLHTTKKPPTRFKRKKNKTGCETPEFRSKVPMPSIKPPQDEFIEMMDSILNKHYIIQVAICANTTKDMMSYHYLNQGLYKTYKNVKLVNVNVMGTGQVHFITADGHYLLLPWCYIIAMFPEKEN